MKILRVMTSIEEYRRWLRGRVDGLSPDLDIFFAILWSTKYTYVVERDVNRALDGIALRTHYEVDTATELPHMDECTMLEFLVGLAKRLDELSYDWEHPNQIPEWFWILIANLGLEDVTDGALSIVGTSNVLCVLDRLLRNDYAPDGSEGGLFPLRHAPGDLRVVELWYQMHNYLEELG